MATVLNKTFEQFTSYSTYKLKREFRFGYLSLLVTNHNEITMINHCSYLSRTGG